MRTSFSFAALFVLCLFLFGHGLPVNIEKTSPVTIIWTDSLVGNFSFTKNWSYPQGVEKKQDGKAGCADGGFCPQRCYGMLDEHGLVLKDSAAIFYTLLDTTHLTHTIRCDAWCYEYAGTDFMEVTRKSADSVFCYTLCDMATHSSLQFDLVNGVCFPKLVLNSIVAGGDAVFLCKKGTMTIDRSCWKKGILKASFHFDFDYENTQEQNMYWSGLIYAPIK
ncbi:MAG: hypothetical protein ACRCYO_19445 [Bacteroidia bacterium]